MNTHSCLKCIVWVFAVLQTVTANPVKDEVVDSGSVVIPTLRITSKTSRHLMFIEGQLMTFECNVTGGDKQKVQQIVLSLELPKNVAIKYPYGKMNITSKARSVSLTKVADEVDNECHVECNMRYIGVNDPFSDSRLVTVFFPPREAAEDLSNGTYVAKGDFTVGQGASLMVRVKANPKPNSVIWKMNGTDLDLKRFQPWTKDVLLNGFWEMGLNILEVNQDDFQSPVELFVQNDHGKRHVNIRLQRMADVTEGWSFTQWMICVAICVLLVVLVSCCCYLQLRKRFEEKATNDDELRQLKSASSIPQKEANHQNVITRVPMTNLKEQNSQIIADNRLIKAVRAGKEEEVRKLLEGGADVEAKLNGSNSLHFAAHFGFLEIVKLLCEKVQNIDVTNDKKKTALMYATEKGHLEVVKHLLSWADSSLVDDEGNTLLHMAVSSGNLKLVEMFVKSANKVPDVNAKNKDHKTALSIAINANNAEICELLIANRADCTDALKCAAKYGKKEAFDVIYKNTPSEGREQRVREAHFEAVESGKLDMFKHICGLPEANPLAVNSIGNTFLHYAAEYGHLNCMPFILEYMKESVDVRNRFGETALMVALYSNREEVVEWLLEQHADIHAVNNQGMSCLRYAAAVGNLRGVEMCLDAGIDINSQSEYGHTALYFASLFSRIHVVKYLMEKGADPEIKDTLFGETYLHAACKKDSLECVKLLVELLPLNSTNRNGKTPLHVAALEGNKEIVAFLLEEAIQRKLEPADSETIIRLTKRIGEVEKDSKSHKDVKKEILEWQYIVKDE